MVGRGKGLMGVLVLVCAMLVGCSRAATVAFDGSIEPRQLGPSSRRTPLTLSEIMYHPAAGVTTNSLEFIELRNTEPVPHDLSGYRISGEIDYVFPSNVVLEGMACLVVAADPAAMAGAYGLSDVLGPFSNRLSNGGGTVRLRNRQNMVLLEARYDDDWPWPTAADGAGHSLVLARPDLGESARGAWSSSARMGGSPGYADASDSDAAAAVRINELLAHTDLPQIDFIELYNASTSSADIGGFVLTDDPATNRFVIPPATVLDEGSHVSFDQDTLGFSLSMHGDDIYLVDTNLNRVIDAVRFDAQANGVSTGRYPDGGEELRVLASPTAGLPNAGLMAQNVVINEIMYHPLSGDADDEYIELHNRGGAAEDLSHWRFIEGVDFVFATGTVLQAGGYLVVARDAARAISNYPALHTGNTLGDYDGRLSDRGERIVLARPDDRDLPDEDFVVVDTVEYADGWGRWSDGDGSSLELIDPHGDNRRRMSWASSDETQKAPWTTFEHTGVLDHGNAAITELHAYYPQAGECLVDDVEVSIQGGATCLFDDFESGVGNWSFNQGNHIRSEWEDGEGFESSGSFHVRASGKGDTRFHSGHGVWQDMWNRATAALNPDPVAGQTATIRGKVRWLKGWPYFVLGLEGSWLEAAQRMDVPANLGTPGAVNSRLRGNAGPTIEDVVHAPAVPAGDDPVTVTCRVADPDGVAAVALRYRLDPSQTTNTATMTDDGLGADALAGDGVYSGTIPGQSSGKLLAFTIEAIDGAGTPAASRYPEEALPRAFPAECLVRFGDPASSGGVGSYRIWMTDAVLSEWTSRHRRSNEPLEVTFVYEDNRVIYNAGARYRGGWRNYSSPTAAGSYSVSLPKADRLLGVAELKLDQTGQNGGDGTRQVERHSAWIGEQLGLPTSYFHLTQVYVNGSYRGVLQDVFTPDLDFVAAVNPGDDNAQMFKLYRDRPHEPHAFTDFLTAGSVKKDAAYRWYWRKRKAPTPDDDFSPLYPLAEALAVADDDLYRAHVGAALDERTTVGYLAVNHVIANRDSYGYRWPHNLIVYCPPDDGAQFYLYDCDMSLNRGNASSSDLFAEGDSMVNRLEAHPHFRRLYWRFVRDAVDGPLLATRSDPVLDAWYAAFQSHGISVSSPQATKDWIAARRTYIQGQLAPRTGVPFEIATPDGYLVINEIMYDAADPYGDFVEIHNLSADHGFDLAGLRLDGVDFTFGAGSLIGPTGFAVVCESVAAYQRLYGNAEVVAGAYDGSLDNGGETLRLLRPVGSNQWDILDEVRYDDDPPWPAWAAGRGSSLQLVDPAHDNSRIGNWAATDPTAPPPWQFVTVTGQSSAGPAFARLHLYLGEAGMLLVDDVCLVAGNDPLVGPNLLQNGDFESALSGPWISDASHSGSTITNAPVHGGGGCLRIAATGPGDHTDRFPATVNQGNLGLSAEATYTLSFWYLPTDVDQTLQVVLTETDIQLSRQTGLQGGAPAVFTPGAPNTVLAPLPVLPRLWINEVMPSNISHAADNEGEFEPWVELYNAGTQAVDLADEFYLSNDPANLALWALPTGIVIQSKERLLVWADGELGETAAGFVHAAFRLNSQSGHVALAMSHQGAPIALDALEYNQVGSDFSYGSYPEGDPSSRHVLHYPSAGLPNSLTSLATPVTINEWMADNESAVPDPADGHFEDWFELYNGGDTDVNLGGYFLSDDPADTNKFAVPGGTVIGARGYRVVWADEETGQNAAEGDLHVSFKLSRLGERIALYAPDGSLVDAVTFGPQAEDAAEGRWPDGQHAPYSMQPPTPGSANRVLGVTALASGPNPESRLEWSAVSGAAYRVDWRESLTGSTWQAVGVATAAGPTATVVVSNAPDSVQGFYRLMRVSP